MTHDFIMAFFGGCLLGVAAVGYLYLNGRIAGVSGMLAQWLHPKQLLNSPAFYFVLGIFLMPFLYSSWVKPVIVFDTPVWGLILAGLLVGFGTRLGSGCTSGHGICGLSRLSKRSMVATGCFMFAGFVTVFVLRHVFGE